MRGFSAPSYMILNVIRNLSFTILQTIRKKLDESPAVGPCTQLVEDEVGSAMSRASD